MAAQMSQTGSSVFRKASLELQEDVQEMHAVRKGNRNDSGPREEGACHLGPWDLRFMCELLLASIVLMGIPSSLVPERKGILKIDHPDCIAKCGTCFLVKE